jgi:hypothetical protein
MNTKSNRWVIGMVVLAAMIGAMSANAAIISDDFNRTGVLNGSTVPTVDPVLYPTGLTWLSTGSGHNNTVAGTGEVGGWNAFLSFTPQPGNQYLLTVVAGPTIQNALHVGFGHRSGIGDYNYFQQDMSIHSAANLGQLNDYGNGVNQGYTPVGTYTLDANTGPGYVTTMELLLDTTSGLATSTLTWSVNSVVKGSWSADVSTYDIVGFGRGDGPNDPNGTIITGFSLDVIPEPATFGMFGVAGIAMLLRRRFVK